MTKPRPTTAKIRQTKDEVRGNSTLTQRDKTTTHSNRIHSPGQREAFKNGQSNQDLVNCFDEVWVISLKRRADRLEQFWREIEKAKWPFRRPQLFDAIEGDKVGVPRFWQTGGGSYGCLRSHLSILERAIQDDVKTILVLEDDAVFKPTFAHDAATFIAKVPQDWECLMLGGQHINSQPIPVSEGIVRAGHGGGIQRTHCYALRGYEPMKALYRTWANSAVHCDWVMGPCMLKFNTYAPHPFLVGQAEGQSDISGRQNPEKFWRSPNGNEPVVLLHAPRAVMEALGEKGWHGGYSRDPKTGFDVGLKDLFADTSLSVDQRNTRLKDWIGLIQAEVASMEGPAICTIWHPKARVEMIRQLVKGKVVKISATTVEEAIKQLPANLAKPPVETNGKIPVVILRASRELMEALRSHGWHTGHWRDEITGQDNGLRRLFASTTDKRQRSAELRRIVDLLHEEAQEIAGGVATLWHDEVTVDLLEGNDLRVMEISAANVEDAIAKLKELTNAQKI
jgi:Glycosyltransferase involved in LPS biosynthesis